MEPKQPNPPKETASVTGPTTPARCRCYPATRSPTQHTHRLQESGATGASSPAFISIPALPHQHHAQPRRRVARSAKNARADMHGRNMSNVAYLTAFCRSECKSQWLGGFSQSSFQDFVAMASQWL